MKVKLNNREKELSLRNRTNEYINAYQTVRDLENNSKLSNLQNLSQFNPNLNINQSSDLNNKGSATQLPYNQLSKANCMKKSPNIFNQRSNSINNFHQGPVAIQNYLKNPNWDNQYLDIKCTKPQKTKRQKSSKKHVLSCNRILNIAKKRDTSSNIIFETQKLNGIAGNYGSSKSKKKMKKQASAYKNQCVRAKNQLKKVQCLSLNQSKAVFNKQDSGNNFPVNYPLSMSHSYIVFSEKDTTLNNTVNFLSKMSKKLQSSNENKLADLKQKLEQMKIQRSAVVIQKHWRGYLTRKLLQDYIFNEESKLINKLSDIKRSKEEFDRFQRLSPGCNKVWVQEEDFDSDLKLSEILDKSQLKQDINKILIKRKIDPGSQQEEDCQQNEANRNMSSSEQVDQYSQSGEDQVYKKQAAIHDPNHHQNIIQSIINVENSESLTSRQTHRVVGYGYGNDINTDKMLENVKNSKVIEKSIATEVTQRNKKKQVKLSKAKQFLISIKPQNLERQQNQAIEKLDSIKEQKNILDQLNSFLCQRLLKSCYMRLDNQRKVLGAQVKNAKISFDELLQAREKLKQLSTQLTTKTNSFLDDMRNIFAIMQNSQQNYPEEPPQPQPQTSNSNINSPRNIKVNRILGKITFQEQKIQQSSEKSVDSFKPSDQKNHPHSPISQYFTIQLPTEELSPHKRKVNFGMESLKAYLENLQKDFLQEQQSTQTAFLCKVLKFNSQNGPQSMVQRCLIQMLVQILTNQLSLTDILASLQLITSNEITQIESTNPQAFFIKKWADQLQKWELGPIQEVSCNMEQSADVTERNNTSKKKKKPLQFYTIPNQN